MMKNIEEILDSEGIYVSATKGVSMLPTLKEGRDTVIILPCKERLKKYDIALYKRGKDFVLHRVIKVLPDSYIFRGDNCIAREYGIKDEDIIGILTECHRQGKMIDVKKPSFKLCSRLTVLMHPIIALRLKLKARLSRKGRS